MILKIIFKTLKFILIILGIIFLLVIAVVGYIWTIDPWHIKPDGVTISGIIKTTSGNVTPIDNIDKNPLLSEEQEATLETLGVKPENLPQEITPEMQKCFTEKLGETRALEIIKGDTLTINDYFKAGSCIN